MFAFACIGVCNAQYAFYFRASVIVGVIRLVVILVFFTEIHSASKLTNADKVCIFYQFVFQRRLMQQAFKRLHGTYVGKQSEIFTHSQKALFRAHFCRRVVVETRVAYCGKEYGIGPFACFKRIVRKRVAHRIDGRRTANGFLIFYFMAEFPGDGIHYGNALCHYFRPNPIAGEHCNLKFHICINICFVVRLLGYRLNVAA